MRKRQTTAVAVGVLAILLSAGCGSSSKSTAGTTTTPPSTSGAPSDSTSASPSASAAGGGLVGVDIPRADTDFWKSYISYVPKSATELGVKITQTNSANDVQKLIANVQALEGQGAKAIVMAPQDTAAIAPTLKSLEGKKIPVVTIDTRPDVGNVFMVVRADNLSYGTKACDFLGKAMKGTGAIAELMGGQDSINGRDRRQGFGDCMKKNYPNIKVIELATEWDGAKASSMLQTALAQNKGIRGVYMHSSFGLAGTLQILKQDHLQLPVTDPKHVFVVSNDGIPEELKDIRAGTLDATVSQPADLFAKYGIFYANAALQGKTFKPGPTDHDSTILQVRPGLLEDELAAPLVTKANVDDKSLWGNNA